MATKKRYTLRLKINNAVTFKLQGEGVISTKEVIELVGKHLKGYVNPIGSFQVEFRYGPKAQ